jgi:hypothetical protein
MTVAFRMSVGRDAKGRYVLAKGSALGAEMAPGPGDVRFAAGVAGAAAGDGTVDGGVEEQASMTNNSDGLSDGIGRWKERG